MHSCMEEQTLYPIGCRHKFELFFSDSLLNVKTWIAIYLLPIYQEERASAEKYSEKLFTVCTS